MCEHVHVRGLRQQPHLEPVAALEVLSTAIERSNSRQMLEYAQGDCISSEKAWCCVERQHDPVPAPRQRST